MLQPVGGIRLGGIDPVQVIQVLIEELQKNLNLGIGYAIPMRQIKSLHPILDKNVL